MWFEHDYYPIVDVFEELNEKDRLDFKTLDDLFDFFSRDLLILSICVKHAHIITVSDFQKRKKLFRKLWDLRKKEHESSDPNLGEALLLEQVDLEKKIIEISLNYKDTGTKVGKVWLETISKINYADGRLIFVFDEIEHYLLKPFISGKELEHGTEHFLYRDAALNPLKNTSNFIYTSKDYDKIVFTLEEKNRIFEIVSESSKIDLDKSYKNLELTEPQICYYNGLGSREKNKVNVIERVIANNKYKSYGKGGQVSVSKIHQSCFE